MVFLLFKTVYKGDDILDNSPIRYSLITFGYPLVCAFFPYLVMNKPYSQSEIDAGCYLSLDNGLAGKILNILFYMLPYFSLLTLEIIVLFMITQKNKYNAYLNEETIKLRYFLSLYPISVFITWIFKSAAIITYDISEKEPSLLLRITSNICYLNGFINSLFMGLEL